MTIQVVGGVYREICVHPRWNDVYGSGGRAALAIAALGTPVTLSSYMDAQSLGVLRERAAFAAGLSLDPFPVPSGVRFRYLHDLARPVIEGVGRSAHPSIRIRTENAVRFGMLEGDAVVEADWAVYDPQNIDRVELFRRNSSSARHLAIVLNAYEAGQLSGRPGEAPEVMAKAIADKEDAEVVAIKRGALGAFVWTPTRVGHVPAYRSSSVWKIGSGDCFVAYFAHAWMVERLSPIDAAEKASRATAYYCETQGLPTGIDLAKFELAPVRVSPAFMDGTQRQVYLAGPFFDLMQVGMIEQVRAQLSAIGLKVFSPYHDIGRGTADDVVDKDLDAIRKSDVLLAIVDGLDAGTIFEIGYARALGKPVVVYSERHDEESLKMMKGSGCVLCKNYATAIYSTLWEAAGI